VIFDVAEDFGRSKLTRVLSGDSGVRLVNVAVSRARYKLIVIANLAWHRGTTTEQSNPLLWKLVVGRLDKETVAVIPRDTSGTDGTPRYESADEARLGAAMKECPGLKDVITQYRILRQDGSLVSRADFAFPSLKYAAYVDGAAWHLTERRWARDRRLRGELCAMGWTVRVFAGHDVGGNPGACAQTVAEDLRSLCAQRHVDRN